ncbi:hypothetical protein D3C87_1979470 [compost metagenome]
MFPVLQNLPDAARQARPGRKSRAKPRAATTGLSGYDSARLRRATPFSGQKHSQCIANAAATSRAHKGTG